MTKELIERFKRIRTARFLSSGPSRKYAFVGMGQHSLGNLYPVLDYLNVPLKYICVTSEDKARLIARRYPSVRAVTSPKEILSDSEVAGVFVAASPSAHFSIASQVLGSGKALFIEKPPCSSLEQLLALKQLCSAGKPIFEAGLQKRYAPAVGKLRGRLSSDRPSHYSLRYRTGAYPEGNPLLDLYIHPLDLVSYLFGEAELLCCETSPDSSLLLVLAHPGGVRGTLELSTSGSWASAGESLRVTSKAGEYLLEGMDTLCFHPGSRKIAGIPLEKTGLSSERIHYLYSRNGFNPVVADNQIVSSGYFGELKAFVDAAEGGRNRIVTSIDDIIPTYRLLDKITQRQCR